MITDKIDKFHLEDINNSDHPSIFFSHELYDLFIFRVPNLKEKALEYISLPFIITDESYFYFDKLDKKFIDLVDIKGFYGFIDKYIDNVLKIIEHYTKKIEEIEDLIYEGKSIKHFNKQWYIYKTDLIRIGRVLNKGIEVFNTFRRVYRKEDDYLELNFEDILEHIQRSHRNSEHLLEKLDSIYNFNLNQTNEQMNRIVYILTLISGIFLPLNLIVGFFGMNTTSLPFTTVGGGTLKVVFLLLISALLAMFLTLLMRRK